MTAITIVVGLVFIITGLLLRVLPPRKINAIYGYRTKSSMKNLDTWTTANKYSASVMTLVGFLLIVVSLGTTLLTENATGAAIGVGFIILSSLLIFVKTESHLKKLFDKEGNRKVLSE